MTKKRKSRKKGSIPLTSVYLVMCVLMIVSFFLPAFQFTVSSGLLGSSSSETWSFLQVLQNTTEGNAYIAAILGLVVTILAVLMIATGILQFFLRRRSLYWLNLGLAMFTMLILSAVFGFSYAVASTGGLGPIVSASVTMHMSVFCYIVGSLVANICVLPRRF